MVSLLARTFISFFLPSGLFFVAAAILLHLKVLARSLPALVRFYPYAVFTAGILLGWRFNRSRLLFAIIILAAADRALYYFAPGPLAPGEVTSVLWNTVAFLLAVNLVLLSLIKERGILTVRGLWRLSLILLEAAAVIVVWRYRALGLGAYMEHSFFAASFLARLPLAQPPLFAFGCGLVVLLIRFLRCRGPITGGFFWALLSVFFALTFERTPGARTVYLATAGLILTISVIESSHFMAYRDELTGLPGRRALGEALLMLGGRYTVAMVDIDHFKKFNDRYGHDVGDDVLRSVAGRLAKVTGGGRAFRYGGEEFTVVFAGKLLDETMPHLERLRKAVEDSDFVIRGRNRPRRKPQKRGKIRGCRQKVTVTVSIGAAERGGHHTTAEQVLEAADRALYRAKKAGRNRIST